MEAIYAGKPVIACKVRGRLNMSPLASIGEADFVDNVADLVKAIKGKGKSDSLLGLQYFYIDGQFSRWKNLLARVNQPSERRVSNPEKKSTRH